MTLINRHPRPFFLALILFVLLVLPSQSSVLARKRHADPPRSKAARVEKGRKLSAKERRAAKRDERLSARDSKRGRGNAKLSKRESKREAAREQATALKLRERKLGRPLSRRERIAETRRMAAQRRREILEARRRAEAARLAAIARQRAIDEALRNEVETMIAHDNTAGEDAEVRRVAVNALGHHAGTVVVMDPMNGKVYSIVNQEWALRRGFKPCSTIKLVTGVAGLSENIINPSESALTSDRPRMDLTSALAHSDNSYFERVGSSLGFDKMVHYARELGLGEKTGLNVPFEYPGRLPEMKPGFTVRRMFSYADGFEVTPLQLGTLVSAMANGGKLYEPKVPRDAQEAVRFKGKLRRKLSIDSAVLQRMVPGMVGAVNYGSGRRAYDPTQTVAGKTGTCNGGDGSWVGLFTSYAPLANPKLAVVVITRGTDAHRHVPAAVAGQIYRDLGRRFGTPTNLQLASAPDDEEQDDDAATAQVDTGDNTPDSTKANSAATAATPIPLITPAQRDNVKRVLMPIPSRTTQTSNAATPKSTTGTKEAGKTTSQPDDRLRRTTSPRP
ncbi:MAG TPA: penicillin-binding transpeptidase domain-containing protein [Pyrinomonadaceae bacterium]|nr:penicillin-binding transpeptidase domain-containing protein [Pyrinomonadaceae bacterium]